MLVVNAYTVGLAGKKSRKFAKDSVDFHLHVQRNQNEPLEAWGFEAKGRVANSCALKDKDYLSNVVRDEHILINDDGVALTLH
jgi:hypothetical protein